MPGALWLLMRLRFGAALRQMGRALRRPKGIALSLLGLLVFVPSLAGAIAGQVLMPAEVRAAQAAGVERLGPPMLLLYCLLTLMSRGAGQNAVAFTPAEVAFLFPGPFSRRQLLAYKVIATVLSLTLSAPFVAVFLSFFGRWYPAEVVGAFLGFLFLHLFAMSVGLATDTAGALAYNRRRKLVLGVVAVAAVAMLMQLRAESRSGTWQELADRIEGTLAGRVLLLPFRPFVQAFLADGWRKLLGPAATAAAIDAGLLAVVFALDAQYLEAAATSSAKRYEALERARRTGGTLIVRGSGRARSRLPMLPRWGGFGPIAWRQLTTAQRDIVRLVLMLLVAGPALVPILVGPRGSGLVESAMAAEGMLLGMGLLMVTMVTFDFRADLDRMPELKALPIGSVRLAAGQVATPLVIVTGLQWALLLLIAAYRAGSGGVPGRYWGFATLALPANLLVVGVENLTFLWFPIRPAGGAGLDMQMLGRVMLLMIVKFLALGTAFGVAFGLGAAAYTLAGSSWTAGLLAAWVVLAAAGVALVPLVGLAFERFDVTRDTPA